ncbi:uncharacterized protein C12orf56 homolog [Centruroides sculpturatus]|uniref:uncharacterized protein C12orf56 homolog n=1 Tax=Centruroides sculpturatus TaxID=218467 RepID=UPI000C6D45D2|nr:uncharacterized protein C12orf56 homolog [Centruroides sculpturatus]
MLPEAPLIRSLIELTNTSTAALYQFVQLAYQEKELTTNQKTYNIPWLVKVLSDQQFLENFLARLMCQILVLTVPSNNEILTPTKSVLLHQQLSVLLTLVSYSARISDHVHLNYAEEFRYYIFSQVISQKVPNEYPVRPNILTLVENVRQQVLDVKHNSRYPSQYITVL